MPFDESQAEDLDAYPIEVVLQHLTEGEANPHQSTATNGAAKSDGLFRSNMATDDTEELFEEGRSKW
jgi:phenol 2-monooxygenase